MEEIYPHVFIHNNEFYTHCPLKNFRWYGEKTLEKGGLYLRHWDPYRSKLAAALKKGLKHFPFREDQNVLYLGASTGTTVSHLADVVRRGYIFGVEISVRMVDKLVKLSEIRGNVVPIMADARKPGEYEEIGKVDVIYEDVSQPDQHYILEINAKKFLKKGSYALLCVKSRSIDVTKPPEVIYREVRGYLEDKFEVIEMFDLEPFDKQHGFFVLRYL